MQPAQPGQAPADPSDATIVLIRNGQPCETGGSYVVVDDEGRFLANISSGTRAAVHLPAGEHLIVAWNPERETHQGLNAPQDVAVMPVSLWPGCVYYAHLAFTAENANWVAPRNSPFSGRYGGRSCGHAYRAMELVPVSPASARWHDVADWIAETQPMTPEVASGQQYVDSETGVREHIDVAVGRLANMSDAEFELRTMHPGECVGH